MAVAENQKAGGRVTVTVSVAAESDDKVVAGSRATCGVIGGFCVACSVVSGERE